MSKVEVGFYLLNDDPGLEKTVKVSQLDVSHLDHDSEHLKTNYGELKDRGVTAWLSYPEKTQE